MAISYPQRRTEPDMRTEFNNTMDGQGVEIPKGQRAVIRKMRRDSNGNLTQCPCVDLVTKEPDKDTFCPVCWGEGWYWDESFIDVYKVVIRSDVGLAGKEDLIAPGLINIPIVIFYTRSSVDVTNKDKIVELITDTAGNPIQPYKREFLYRIGTPIDFRSDNGRLEYWKLDCYAEQRKFLNGPGG